MSNPPSMDEREESMQSWSESTMMFVDPFLQPPHQNIGNMLFLLMNSIENVGSSSWGGRMKFSQSLSSSRQ